ncbi:aminotransferase class I/II-fold pyridoxal phosphate-dependent enzyme [Antarcticibacterium flavum]|uniref:Aminotransferase class I/II-fold pyridoxal phosphate-dependent enzyme n=1 Tax=Antarcticibacterium flavum TaxID=2058175 RepID=A0A5B7X2P2_9FLAO|nr:MULTISPECIES: methionine aminotransferase [Antarcticibacterium]MCM4160562.1 methionine aminotransferase [Antarcticibacterium sp. W02-3]QCY69776.1 aminotransferase class I/II-fold pyridoxal phosphate-dependent enzyme [Antarcticibacterium flavum]
MPLDSLPSSKLPGQQESIFSKMSRLSAKNKAVDLSQGFPDFPTDDRLKELVTRAMNSGYNQYAPMAGVYELREQISNKISKLYSREYDPEREITITNGATQAIYSAITAFVGKGDEVIVLKPAYDSYEPTIKLNGGVPVLIQLKGKDYKVDWQEVKDKITSRTRMMIINTPHNPTGTVLSREDMHRLEETLKGKDIILLSDEVYEHLIFDGQTHQSAALFPDLASRAIICASFGKTFHNTGWKTGYCVAPAELMAEIWKVHQFQVFCINHPMQRAYAEYLKDPENYLGLPEFYEKKRDKFLELIDGSRFKAVPSGGTYFQLLDYSEITTEADTKFAERLVSEHKLATIPISVFNIDNRDNNQLRFCFAKTVETLEKASEIIHRI